MEELLKAHKFSYQNKIQLEKDSVCGCFQCLEIYHPNEIKSWIDDSPETAECPYCYIDSVIGESSGFPITKEFLKKMNKQFF